MLKRFFRRKEKKENKEYDNKLIQKFQNDHKELLELYGNILSAYDNKEKEKLYGYVKRLKTFFIFHLYEEDKKLYSFLAENKENDKINEEVYSEMHEEIGIIKVVVIDFLKEYRNILEVFPPIKFKEDFEKIGIVLVQRIELEEEILYSMYDKGK